MCAQGRAQIVGLEVDGHQRHALGQPAVELPQSLLFVRHVRRQVDLERPDAGRCSQPVCPRIEACAQNHDLLEPVSDG
jgi:hypothetical protein